MPIILVSDYYAPEDLLCSTLCQHTLPKPTDKSRASPNVPDGLTKGWFINGDNCSVGIPREQSNSVVRI